MSHEFAWTVFGHRLHRPEALARQSGGEPILSVMWARMLTFRTAAEQDLDRLVTIHRCAFPDERGESARRRNFESNPLGDLQCLHVAEDQGHIVGHAFLFPLATHFGGRAISMGGIASVAVAPEARGRGVARALLDHLHDLSAREGFVLNLLYGFRQGFYRPLGYVPWPPSKYLSVSPKAIDPAWNRESREREIVLRPAHGGDRQSIERMHEDLGARSNGRLVRSTRSWDRLLLDEATQWFVAEERGSLVGYTSFRIGQTEPHAPVHVWVNDVVARTPAANRAIVAFFGRMGDQVHEVHMHVAPDDPIDRAMVDGDRARSGTEAIEHPLGILVGAPLVRVVDVERALAARGYAGDGELLFHLPRTNDYWLLRTRGGGASSVEKVGADMAKGFPPLALDVTALTSILYAGLDVADAAALGFLSAEEGAIRRATELLTLTPPFTTDAF